MAQRPLPLAIIAWLFILVGAGGVLRGLYQLDKDAIWVIASGAVALAGGILLWHRSPWGRWLILVWLAFHVVIGFMHGVEKGVMHALLLVIIGFFLLRKHRSI